MNDSDNQKDILYMNIALELAKQAAQVGEVPVGAILVKDDKIVAKSFNNRHLSKDPTGHAEILVIQNHEN